MKDSDYKYCPRCKSDLKNTDEAFVCDNCGAKIYKNSAPTSSVLIIDKDKVLLSKRKFEPFKGKYDIIGGFLKNGEDPITGVLRETEEETGLKIKIIKLLGVYMDTYGPGGMHTLNFNYVGKIISGKMKAADDVAELEWAPIMNLPKPAFKGQIFALKDLQKWYLSQDFQKG
jgi:ADP-ribose pyrophosphatase YjhB (NUDIX family)